MSKAPKTQNLADHQSKATLVRLANSCARAATRGAEAMPVVHDLDTNDFKMIADILNALAAEIPD